VRSKRLKDLHKILHEGRATSQKDILEGLRSAGHRVTQATVSRDLRDIGATKVRLGAEVAYRLPDEIPRSTGGDFMARSLVRALAEFAIDIRAASSLVIVSTAPGHASAVARAIDMATAPEVAGTIAGDDTVFVATEGAEVARLLSERWLTAGAVPEVAEPLAPEVADALPAAEGKASL